MRFVLFALVAIGLASSVFAEASVDDTSLLKRQIIRPGTLAIPLPVGKPAPVPAKPAPSPVAKPIPRPGTLRIWWRSLTKRQIIRPGTLAIPLPVGKAPVAAPKPAPKPKPAPIPLPGRLKIWFKRFSIGTIRLPLPIGKPVATAPKPAPKPAPVKVTPPGTINIIRVWRKLMKRFSIGSLKIPLPVGKPVAKAPPPPPPKPVVVTRPGTIKLPLGWKEKRSLASCTGTTIACPVPGLLHGFDCVDIARDGQQCGDCLGELCIPLPLLFSLSLSLPPSSSSFVSSEFSFFLYYRSLIFSSRLFPLSSSRRC